MVTVNPYIYFNGNCEEAFNLYQKVFRKKITYIGRYKDVPGSERQLFVEADDKIMHITLPLSAETVLMGSDHQRAYEETMSHSNFSLIVHTETQGEADRIFNELTENGKIKIPMNVTFWGSYYGICVDRFGIIWKITTETK